MGAHVIALAPPGAGKSSLMRGLVRTSGPPGSFEYSIDRGWITRERRPGEDQLEYNFVTLAVLRSHQAHLLRFEGPYGQYACALEWPPRQLSSQEICMRALLPVNAQKFIGRVAVDCPGTNVICCAIMPGEGVDLEARMRGRDPDMSDERLATRLAAVNEELEAAARLADISFVNTEGLKGSIASLRQLIENHCLERGY